MKPTICTFTGVEFNVFCPRVEDVRIEDIAHALSCIPRFSGHTRDFYSVAQHSWNVSLSCPLMHAAYGLLHDAAEAYLLDIPTPIKQHVRFVLPSDAQMAETFGAPVTDNEQAVEGERTVSFGDIERNLLAVIYRRFGLDPAHAHTSLPSVKAADLAAYERERANLMPLVSWWPVRTPPRPVSALRPVEAEDLFLRRFYVLLQRGALTEVAP